MARHEGSIRWLMERHGWTSAQARKYKGEQEGIAPNVALGHAPKGEPGLRELRKERAWGASFYALDAEGYAVVVSCDMSYADAQRAGKYMQLTERLAKGRISPEDFRRRVRRLGRIDGRRPLSDPAAVLAIAGEERALRRRGEPRVTWESGKQAVARARQLLLDRHEREPKPRLAKASPSQASQAPRRRPRRKPAPPTSPAPLAAPELFVGLDEAFTSAQELLDEALGLVDEAVEEVPDAMARAAAELGVDAASLRAVLRREGLL